MKWLTPQELEVTHFCLFAGMGGGSLGLQRGHARVGRTTAQMRCLGGVDVWPAAMRDFTRLTGSPGTVLDLFAREDYVAFHGKEPPAGWREATPEDLRTAAGGEAPDILFTSPPCKGFSGLLSNDKSASQKYQALNRLTLRGLWLSLEAWSDNPPSLILLENVPRIQTRGRELLDHIVGLLQGYGYAVRETTHDCGDLGGLAQHRKRFLLVARHTKRVRPFLYQVQPQPLRSIGDVLGQLPLPGDPRGGRMHRLPALTWMTWVRLALIEAGKDWRSLNALPVVDGYLRDLAMVPQGTEWHADNLGVRRWSDVSGTVKSRAKVTSGNFAVADPRLGPVGHNNVFRVARWSEVAAGLRVSDPHYSGSLGDHSGKMLVQLWEESARTVTGTDRVGSGAQVIADPRYPGSLGNHSGKMQVQQWADPARTVTGTADIQAGALVIADPRMMLAKSATGDWAGGGQYGVADWSAPSRAVVAKAKHDTGYWSVADPRDLPAPGDRLDPAPFIISEDGTRHRPMTTLELAAIQSYPVFGVDGEPLVLDGNSEQAWRERVGNSVPPDAAAAIGSTMAHTLLWEALGVSFVLSATPIWVRPFATALSTADLGEVSP